MTIALAPSTGFRSLPSGVAERLETWLESQRDQLQLWLPVALRAGIGAWLVLDDADQWRAWLGRGCRKRDRVRRDLGARIGWPLRY